MISEKILQYIPAPSYLNTPYAGLAMSDAHIRVIQFESVGTARDTGSLKVKTYAELPLPAGAITSGRVNTPDQIIPVLKELKEKTGVTYVRVSMPEEKAYLFEIEIPKVDPKEIRSAIEFKIEENVPLPMDQVIFDYVIVEEEAGQHAEKHTIRAIVSALPVKFVTIYMDLFRRAGFIPYVFEIESQAIARALLRPSDVGTYLIMHVSRGKIAVCVASERVVHFTSTLNPPDDWQDAPDFVVSEIGKIILYWKNNHADAISGNRPIEKILLSGDSLSASVNTALSAGLGVAVVVGDVWTNAFDVNVAIPAISFADSLQYTAAIGLALPADSLI
jgi:Tfp pilus assembly PilM family ATPase